MENKQATENPNPQSAGSQNPQSEQDPIADKSLSGVMLVSAALLFLSLVWALYDEVAGTRPWKEYQEEFVRLYTSHLKKLAPEQARLEKEVRSRPEFVKLEEQLTAAERKVAPRVQEISEELSLLRAQLQPISGPFLDARAKIAALTYELDHADSESEKKDIRQEIEEVKTSLVRGPWSVVKDKRPLTHTDNGQRTTDNGQRTTPFDELEQRFNSLKAQEANLNSELAEITAEATELRRARDAYLKDNLPGLEVKQIAGLIKKMDDFTIEIKQINIEEKGAVDRCESCHVGIREPITLRAADMGGKRVFVSHPSKLLDIHDPDRFGCTSCHNGNGRATSAVEKAHGNYKHWLWPLFPKENSEAGCIQCHAGDRVLEHAPVLTEGRDLFQLKGCVGCHRYEGYDRETDALAAVRKEMQRLESEQRALGQEIERSIKAGDEAATNEEARQFYAQAEKLRVQGSNADAKLDVLDHQAKFLMQDCKMIGPNLKEVRLKLRPEWIPVWLKDPQAFRPGTKMPKFRLSDDEIKAIAAFIWQSGLKGPGLPTQGPGDPVKGKEQFETRGCLACHSVGEGNRRLGGDFAANLSRLGEKANYDYIVRWIHNPRERTRPYCPKEKRDLGPEDYSRAGLPFIFDLDHSTCPNDGAELQVQHSTVMPSLRLSESETRDIASFLLSLKHKDASYAAAAYMDDAKLAASGRALVRRYGCANCHEISGLEDEQRIGTELTKEASKPIEQLDFGLLEHQAKKAGWYNHKGFFERKLENPAIYDQGRQRSPEEQLKMPNIQLTPEDRRALTTFLLGSLDTPVFKEFRNIPEEFRYVPSDQRKDIQEGWWIVKKYNCMGCHTIMPGQKSVLSTVPRYQDPAWKEQLPPSLVQQGARVNPNWLVHFLSNPALSPTDTDRNGVRSYLKARMPTFFFSPNEVSKLVRFFEGLSAQPQPFIEQKLDPLTDQERTLARALFSSRAAPCLKCHLVGRSDHDRFATAPNFLLARERLKPGWTARWMINPQAISPGTAMPSGLFKHEQERWVFAGPTPDMFKGYTKDHVQLLVRYMFQLTPEEQRRLVGSIPATSSAQGSTGSVSDRINPTVRAALSH
jgi:cytochrome c2